jgi:predicted nucleic acid-binding protein
MSLVVDSSVWIDFFNGILTPQVKYLDLHLDREEVVVGDLVAVEVLQGFREEKDLRIASKLFESCSRVHFLNWEIALATVSNYRKLAALGKRPRKTIDVIIATYCIERNHQLLHSDKDFDELERFCGLQCVG